MSFQSKKKLIVFDLDGVLIDSLPNMRYALLNTAKHINQKISFNKYKRLIGLPFEKILSKLKVKGNFKEIKSIYSMYSMKRINKLRINKKKLTWLKNKKKNTFLQYLHQKIN